MARFSKFGAWLLGVLAAQALGAGQAAAQAVGTDQGASVVRVVVGNQRGEALYVAFTVGNGQQAGPITWSNNCTVSNNQVLVPARSNCAAIVPASVGSSRFCASTSAVATPNCYLAQTNHQTMIETTFGTGAAGNCYPTSMSSCVYYDISLIPATCTDPLWQTNYCANTGGAAYNLPVQLSCANQPTFTCQGPPGTKYGNSRFPANCGNPAATCVGNTQSCVNAYFHPMFVPPYSSYQPVAQCPGTSAMQITFLAGP